MRSPKSMLRCDDLERLREMRVEVDEGLLGRLLSSRMMEVLLQALASTIAVMFFESEQDSHRNY